LAARLHRTLQYQCQRGGMTVAVRTVLTENKYKILRCLVMGM